MKTTYSKTDKSAEKREKQRKRKPKSDTEKLTISSLMARTDAAARAADSEGADSPTTRVIEAVTNGLPPLTQATRAVSAMRMMTSSATEPTPTRTATDATDNVR